MFTAEQLEIAVQNDRRAYDAFWNSVKLLRAAVDRVAERVAKENADWHDDPEADDHAEYHAPADQQFPREVRDECIKSLFAHYVGELTLSENGKAVRQ